MIREARIKRFKRFEDEVFDLRGHVILAGPNNCGKTTVLQAIAAWSLAFREWKKLNDFQRHGGAYSKAPVARLAFSAVPVRVYDLLWRDRQAGKHMEITIELEDRRKVTMEFHGNSTEQIYVRPKKDVEPNFLQGLSLDVVYLSTVSGLSIEEPVYQPEYIDTLLGRQRPGDVIRNLLLLASNTARWNDLVSAIDRLFGVTLLVPNTLGGQIICEYQNTGHATTFDLLSAGSGFQQVIVLLASLFTRQGSLILVDEPDAHLHVFLQEAIFSELRKAAAGSGSQLVLATHSEVILDSAEPDQICVVIGKPYRLATGEGLKRLKQAMSILKQSDVVAAQAAPGIFYCEGYTDLNLLRAWAVVLGHPTKDYFERTPFWQPVVFQSRVDGPGIKANDHFQALQTVKQDITGVWLVDPDGRRQVDMSANVVSGTLNRLHWSRYESESYLLHPAPLARYITERTEGSGEDAVKDFFTEQFGSAEVFEQWKANPFSPPPIVENYFKSTKARTGIVGSLLERAGIHGKRYTEFDEIAALMLPAEVHPEVKEKLDFIQQAFRL